MNINKVVFLLNELSPLNLAADWDNVGLLVNSKNNIKINNILLTIDLTEAVLKEAIKNKINLIISYHPFLFNSFNKINCNNKKNDILIHLIKNDIAVYSPHTALDNIENGINDWLANSLNEDTIETVYTSTIDPLPCAKIVHLKKSMTIYLLSKKIKEYLNLKYLRIASVDNKEIKSIAFCAGSGSDILKNINADCYVTGEMSHHNILSANANGIHVILSEHTHTERGYLKIYKKMIKSKIDKNIKIMISKFDRDPIKLI